MDPPDMVKNVMSRESITKMLVAGMGGSENKLREIFKLDLFGFDLLVTSEKREMVVVDVNYFPSYKEMSEYWPKLLAEYLVEMHLVRTKLSAGTSTGTGATTTGATTTTPIA